MSTKNKGCTHSKTYMDGSVRRCVYCEVMLFPPKKKKPAPTAE